MKRLTWRGKNWPGSFLGATLTLGAGAAALLLPSAAAADDGYVAPLDLKQKLAAEREMSMDMPLNRRQFRGAHNAWNHGGTCHEDGGSWIVSENNQYMTLTELLDHGARVLDLDAHWHDDRVELCHSTIVDCAEFSASWNEPFSDGLQEVANWLAAPGNEREIVILTIEDQLPTDEPRATNTHTWLNQELLDAFGTQVLWLPDLTNKFPSWPGGPWPTSRDLLTWPGGPKRVIVKISSSLPDGFAPNQILIKDFQFVSNNFNPPVQGVLEPAPCFNRYNDNTDATFEPLAIQGPANPDAVIAVSDNKSQGSGEAQGYIVASHGASPIWPVAGVCDAFCVAGSAGCHEVFADTNEACTQAAFPIDLVQQCNVNIFVSDRWTLDFARASVHTWAPSEPSSGEGSGDCAYADSNGLLHTQYCGQVHPYFCTRKNGETFVTTVAGTFQNGAAACAWDAPDTQFMGPGKPFESYKLPVLSGHRDTWVNLSRAGAADGSWTRNTSLPQSPPGFQLLPAGNSGTLMGTTAGATDFHKVDPACSSADGPDVAYQFTVTLADLSVHGETVYFDTYGSAADTILTITDGLDDVPTIDEPFDPSAPNLGQTCNDDSGCSGSNAKSSRVWATLTTPGKYYVVVDSHDAAGGSFQLHWARNTTAPVDKNPNGMNILQNNVPLGGWSTVWDTGLPWTNVNYGVTSCAGGGPSGPGPARSYGVLACPGDTIVATTCVGGNAMDTVLDLRDGTGTGNLGGPSPASSYLACNDDALLGCHVSGASPYSSTLQPYVSPTGGMYILDVNRYWFDPNSAAATPPQQFAVSAAVLAPGTSITCSATPCTSLDTVTVGWAGVTPPGPGAVNAVGVYPSGTAALWWPVGEVLPPFPGLTNPNNGQPSGLSEASTPHWLGADPSPRWPASGQVDFDGVPPGQVVGRAIEGDFTHGWLQLWSDSPSLQVVPPNSPDWVIASEAYSGHPASLAGDGISHASGNDTTTWYSSNFFGSSNNDRGVYLWAHWSNPSPRKTLILHARMAYPPNAAYPTRVPNGFPSSYQVWLKVNGLWGQLGAFQQQPDAHGRVAIDVSGWGAVQEAFLEPVVLGTDYQGNHYFQMAEIDLQ